MSDYTAKNPSPRYQELERVYRQIHETGLKDTISAESIFQGKSLLRHISTVAQLARHVGARTVLDYGAGKAKLYRETDLELPDGRIVPSVREYWGVEEIRPYDPGVKEFATRPTCTFDGLVSTDVLEHIPEEDIDWVLEECFAFATRFVFMNIASYPAEKVLPNGWNAHVTIQPVDWWRARIETAAAAWEGDAYVFLVTEKRTDPVLAGTQPSSEGKWKTTSIERWR